MRVVHIIHGVSNPSAGTTYYVAKLADELQRLGDNSSILTLGYPPHEWSYEAPLVVHSKLLERHAGISLGLLRDVRVEATLPGILHGHGVWRLTNLFPLMLNGRQPSKIMFSPHGTLTPWSLRRRALVKAPFWRLLQKPALERSHCYHVTAPSEYEDIRRLGLRGPVAIVPCGVDIPEPASEAMRRKRVVFMSRIDPKKGLDILIPAWRTAAEYFGDWELIIAGPLGSDYAAAMEGLAADLNAPRIKFAGQLLGKAKRELLDGASIFVLPSYSENFGIVVAEAFAHGVPVITSTETPWLDIAAKRCGWVVRPRREELEAALREAMSLPLQVLQGMGGRGRDWMREGFSWEHTTSMMQRTYEWLLHGGRQPDWVISD